MPSWILIILLGVLVLFSFFAMKKQKSQQAEQFQKLETLKAGDKVRTHLGIYVTIIKIYESTDGKIAVVEMGEGDNKVKFELEMRFIMGLDQKTEIVFDEATKEEDITENKQIEEAKEEIKKQMKEDKENLNGSES